MQKEVLNFIKVFTGAGSRFICAISFKTFCLNCRNFYNYSLILDDNED